MIKLSRQTDYALQLIFALHQLKKGRVLSLKSFSKESNISFLFLQKIARRLRHAGLVEASKGAHGGYTLKMAADTISMRALIEAVDGPYGMTACTRHADCRHETRCVLRSGMQRLNAQILETLEATPVTQMIETL